MRCSDVPCVPAEKEVRDRIRAPVALELYALWRVCEGGVGERATTPRSQVVVQLPRNQSDVPSKLPAGYPASLIYIDESGVASNDRFFVIGAVKVRNHGEVMRAVRDVRDRHHFFEEFRWTKITRAKLGLYYDLVDQLKRPSLQFAACVVDRQEFDPFQAWPTKWESHAQITAQLLRGCINRRELVSVAMDLISTPRDVAIEDEIRGMVNRRFRNLSVVTAACLDSRSCDGLQLADVLAGAVAFEHRRLNGLSGQPNSNKAKVLDRIKTVLEVETLDGRTPRVNVARFRRTEPRKRPGLIVVKAV